MCVGVSEIQKWKAAEGEQAEREERRSETMERAGREEELDGGEGGERGGVRWWRERGERRSEMVECMYA